VRRAARDADSIRKQTAFARHWQRAIGQSFALPGSDVIGIGQASHASPLPTTFTTTELPSSSNGLLAASARHQLSHFVSPKSWRKGVEMRGGGAELGISQSHFTTASFHW